jgi:hypothetical protein
MRWNSRARAQRVDEPGPTALSLHGISFNTDINTNANEGA